MSYQSDRPPGVLTARTVDGDGIAVVVAAGEIDMVTEGTPLADTVTVLARRPAGLVVDLRAVSFFGSSGINLLVDAQERARPRGVPFAVVAAHQIVLEPLAVTGMDVLLPLFANLPDACAAMRAQAPVVPSQTRRCEEAAERPVRSGWVRSEKHVRSV